MRIISGTFKGRRLHPPANLPVRPTTDFAKEGLFNVLNNLVDFESLKVLDLFCGTGSISMEFISREALQVTAVDINARCLDFIRRTAESMGVNRLQMIRMDVFSFLKRPGPRFDLIFADPPYDLKETETIPDLVFGNGLLTDDGMLILEHSSKHSFEFHPNFYRHRSYGSVNFTFFSATAKESTS